MTWIAEYHDRYESRSYKEHNTWEEARAAIADEVGQRIMALEEDPGVDDADELEELKAAFGYFTSEVCPGEEAAQDAGSLTFSLVPEHAAELAGQVDELTVEVIR